MTKTVNQSDISNDTNDRDYYVEFNEKFKNYKTDKELFEALEHENSDDQNHYRDIALNRIANWISDNYAFYDYSNIKRDALISLFLEQCSKMHGDMNTIAAILSACLDNDHNTAISNTDRLLKAQADKGSMSEKVAIFNVISVMKNAFPGYYKHCADYCRDNDFTASIVDLFDLMEKLITPNEDDDINGEIETFYNRYPESMAADELYGFSQFTNREWSSSIRHLKYFKDSNIISIIGNGFINTMLDYADAYRKVASRITDHQIKFIDDGERHYVSAYIANFTEHDNVADMEEYTPSLTGLLTDGATTQWSAPRWSHQGDVVLFQYSKNAINNIRKVEKDIKGFSQPYIYQRIDETILSVEREFYKQYGGKIIAVGRLSTDAAFKPDYAYHYYADIDQVTILDNPLDVSAYRDFLKINQGGITPLWGDVYERIKSMIIEKNDYLPEYFINTAAMTKEESDIDDNNWLEKNLKNHREYHKEAEFRSFYLDYLLRRLSDDGKFYVECACYKDLKSPSYADYEISFDDQWLPVEAKINIDIEPDIVGQVSKYCDVNRLLLSEEDEADLSTAYNDHVLIVDENRIEMFDYNDKTRTVVTMLDNIKTEEDITKLKDKIGSLLQK